MSPDADEARSCALASTASSGHSASLPATAGAGFAMMTVHGAWPWVPTSRAMAAGRGIMTRSRSSSPFVFLASSSAKRQAESALIVYLRGEDGFRRPHHSVGLDVV
jgi:hypothetical protein